MSAFSAARAFRERRTPAQTNSDLMKNAYPLLQRGMPWMSRDSAHDFAELQKQRVREALQKEIAGINYKIGGLGITDRREIQRLRVKMTEIALERSHNALQELEGFKHGTEYLGDRGGAAAGAGAAVGARPRAEKEGYVMKPATVIANDYIDELLAMSK